MPEYKRPRGTIERLPSGALRAKVYVGLDPISKRRLYLTETIPPGPRAKREADDARVSLINQIIERRNPRSRATVNQLIDRFLETHAIDPRTRKSYTSSINKHVKPLLGKLSAGRVGPEVLESFYAELRRCRDHCDGKKRIQHRTKRQHICDEHARERCVPPQPDSCHACKRMCRPHTCRALGDGSSLKIHWILSASFDAGVRWGWIAANPCEVAKKPSRPTPNPDPPTPREAAQIVTDAARKAPDWGVLVWTAMNTGARRGELCALRWSRVDLDTRTVEIKRAIGENASGELVEKDTKTHQQRRVVIDEETVHVLRAHRARFEARAAALGFALRDDAYVFSTVPDGSTFLVPDSVTQRYDRMAERLGIDTTLHRLRHYSATELINAGVDLRAVAGRLGHSGGGSTTLRVYAAWTSEADQRASSSLSARMPQTPRELLGNVQGDNSVTVQPIDDGASGDCSGWSPAEPYLQIAADIRAAITCGALREGTPLPTQDTLASRYGVANSTAHRALAKLHELGLTEVTRGRRAVVSAAGWKATQTRLGRR